MPTAEGEHLLRWGTSALGSKLVGLTRQGFKLDSVGKGMLYQVSVRNQETTGLKQGNTHKSSQRNWKGLLPKDEEINSLVTLTHTAWVTSRMSWKPWCN